MWSYRPVWLILVIDVPGYTSLNILMIKLKERYDANGYQRKIGKLGPGIDQNFAFYFSQNVVDDKE